MTLLFALAQGFVLIAASPLIIGSLTALHRQWQGRAAPGVLQYYRTVWRRYQLPAVRPQESSCVYGKVPLVLLLVYGSLAFIVPPFGLSRDVALQRNHADVWGTDLLVIVFILAFGRYALILAGLDSSSGFGGFGAARLALLQVLAEPSLLLVALVGSSFAVVDQPYGAAALAALFVAILLLFLADVEWLPVANPDTHKELTMVSEAIVVEFAGRDLADVNWAEAIKVSALGSTVATLGWQTADKTMLRFQTALAPLPVPVDLALVGLLIGGVVLGLLVGVATRGSWLRLIPQIPRLTPAGVQMHHSVVWVAAVVAATMPTLLRLGSLQ